MIVSSAPGRCGIIGNPTDMYGGSVVACSTFERAHCRLMDSPHLVLTVSGVTQEIHTTADLQLQHNPLDIPKAILSYLKLGPESLRCRLSAHTDIPECAGLAGSTALVIAVLGAVLQKIGVHLDRYQIAETARKIEYRTMGIICGFQDQYMAAFGGTNFMDFRGKQSLEQRDDEPLATIEPMQDKLSSIPFVIAHTGISRNSGIVHRNIRERWLGGEPAVVEGYQRIAKLGRMGREAMLNAEWITLGKLMGENHAIQRSLGGSGLENDRLIDVALQNGALGAKLAGAGRGGTIVALTLEPERTVAALRSAGVEQILWPRPVEGLTVERSLTEGDPVESTEAGASPAVL